MPWFRVDDGFYDHPKAIAAGDALGLWLRAGCWSAKQLTDGFLPRNALKSVGGTPKKAQILVDARARPDGVGLWIPADDGWWFHDWFDYQPSRSDTLDKRAKRADAGRLGGVKSGQTRRAQAGQNEANGQAHASRIVEPPARPGPARTQTPLLTLAGRLTEVDAHDLAAGLPRELLDEWQSIAGACVDLEVEARAYLARHGDSTPSSPRGAWLGWLRAARKRALPIERRPSCVHPECVDGWLSDDADARPVPCPSCRPHLRPVESREAAS